MPTIDFPATPTQAKFINSEKYLVFILGSRGEGKALRNGTPVLTPSGWVKVEDVSVGDQVVAGDGTPTAVLGVYPQPEQPLYRVRFSDKTWADVTDDHLWAGKTKWDPT